jgi:hypothetical protein
VIERKYGSPSTVRVNEYESSRSKRIRRTVAIAIANVTAVGENAIVSREGQIPMVGSYLRRR